MSEEETPEAKPAKAPKKLLQDPPITVGRLVLYQQHANQPSLHTALVCKIWSDEVVNLKVTDENGHDYVMTSVSKGNGIGQWRFPTRVGGES